MCVCPECGSRTAVIPPEPPIGTWVKDRHGATAQRHKDSDGRVGWSPPGCYAGGKWAAMWQARGPLTVCGPWGRDLEPTPDSWSQIGAAGGGYAAGRD